MGLSEKCFAPQTVEERTVELGDGTTETVYFRHLPSVAFERFAIWTQSEDENVRAMAHARMLALGLCEATGEDALTEQQAARLKRPVMLRLFSTLLEVNDMSSDAIRRAKADAGKP